MRLTEYLEKLLGRKVDVLTPGGVRTIRVPEVKKRAYWRVLYMSRRGDREIL